MAPLKLEDSRILIVDDVEDHVRLLERVLSYAGFHNYRSTSEPREVLMLTTEFHPDLILLDLNMPRMDGFDILQQLGATSLRADISVMMLTADDSPESMQKALRLGAKDFLGKPFSAAEVILRVRRLLETQRRLSREIEEQHSLHQAETLV